MKIYDISMTISHDMQVYKNKEEKKPLIEVVSDFSNSTTHESKLSMNLHTGTHMDFPLHIFENGETSNALDIHKMIRWVKVFDLTHLDNEIDSKDLINLQIEENDFVLFKTKNSLKEIFDFHFIFINEKAANYLALKKISGVGVDGLGVERNQKGHLTHQILMKNDIIIIEGLRLKDIKQGHYFMYALPIKIREVDALPLSIILIEEPYENQISNTK